MRQRRGDQRSADRNILRRDVGMHRPFRLTFGQKVLDCLQDVAFGFDCRVVGEWLPAAQWQCDQLIRELKHSYRYASMASAPVSPSALIRARVCEDYFRHGIAANEPPGRSGTLRGSRRYG